MKRMHFCLIMILDTSQNKVHNSWNLNLHSIKTCKEAERHAPNQTRPPWWRFLAQISEMMCTPAVMSLLCTFSTAIKKKRIFITL